MNIKTIPLIIALSFSIVLFIISLFGIINIPAFLVNNSRIDIRENFNNDLNIQNVMIIKSPAFQDNQHIPSKYSCEGEDVNPPLIIENVPKDSKTLLLIVDDPDASSGDWVHWIVYNISPETESIDENNIPENSVQGVNSWGNQKYQGPCPPGGTHRYQFRLFALDKDITEKSNKDKAAILNEIEGSVIVESILTGLYSNNK